MSKKRVVITGIGTISPIGNNIEEIDESLKGKVGSLFSKNTKILVCDLILQVLLMFLFLN